MNAGGTVDVTLILWGENLVPGEVTNLLGIAPTRSRAKGESLPGRPLLRHDLLQVGMWTLSTAGYILSQNLSDHVAFLVEKLGCKIQALKERGLIDQARLSLLVHVGESKLDVASWEDELDAELIADIAKLGASLAITVMWPLPEDENPS